MRFISCLLILSAFEGVSQELPPIQNYAPSAYKGGNQNWSISQSRDKLIYIANNAGLLEFNGAIWTLYPSPNQTIVRSVKVIDDKIYTGSYMEFGYWKKNDFGTLTYQSVSQDIGLELLEDEEFWKIIQIDEWIIFQSLKRIYIYHPENQEIRVLDSDELITGIFSTDHERILFQRINKGIFEIVNGKDSLLLDNDVLKNDEVIYVGDDGSAILLLTKNSGFYEYSNGVLEPVSSSIDKYQNLEMYSATPLSNNRIAIGSISQGVLILDEELRLVSKVDQQAGLMNNTVLALFEDVNKNIWAGLDNGISNIELDAPIHVFEDQDGRLGSVYATAIYNGNLYLGTNQGLYYRPLASIFNTFRFVESTEGQVWNLNVFDDKLWVSHHDGTFLVDDNGLNQIGKVKGTWNTKPITENLLLQGNYDGLYVLTKSNKGWTIRNKVKGFSNSSRYFEIQDSTILVNHEYKGIFTLSLDRELTEVKLLKMNTTLKGANSGLAKFKEKILYSSKEGIFYFDDSQLRFIRDSLLSSYVGPNDYVSGRMLSPRQGELWLFLKNELVKISSGRLSDIPTIERVPLLSSQRRNIVEYENIIALNNPNSYLIGTSFGYLILDTDRLKTDDFQVYLSSIKEGTSNNQNGSGNDVRLSEKSEFDTGDNNLFISFHSPEYKKYFTPSYQYQLKGEYNQWSEWTKQPYVFYENIPPGNYTFNVRSKIGNRISSNVASYEFVILKPWFAKDFMIASYILSVMLFSIFMHNVYRVYYKRQQAKIIEQNKKELELEKLRSEQEIIRFKNQQLEKDNRDKSNELAASTMSIIKKNEILTQIKEQLESLDKAEITKPVVKIIDKNLNHNQNWEMFKDAFEMADGEFFKNLKEKHSNLSPNDLKLCAYLRLNLSSKEVSQLINISPKSVEVKRYRLRKKLGLDNNENLTNYILSI